MVLETAVLNGAALQPDAHGGLTVEVEAPRRRVSEEETLARIRDAARALASARGDEPAGRGEPADRSRERARRRGSTGRPRRAGGAS